jgi:hypothetical protein
MADLAPAARQRLTSMPCDAGRLMRLRFRGHGDDVAESAVARWAQETTSPAALRADLQPPVDARVWSTSWPSLALAIPTLDARFEAPASLGEPLPEPSAAIFGMLQALHAVDPLCAVLTLDGVRGVMDPPAWRAGLGASDVAFADQVALALFRAAVLAAGAFDGVTPVEARICASERWLGRGGRSEVAALSRARDALGDPSLAMTTFRRHSREGAVAALESLQRHPVLGVVVSPDALRAFRRALQLEPDGEEVFSFEEPLYAFFARQLADAGARTPDAHASATKLVRFAAGDGAPDSVLSLLEHLACCRDDRCSALVRAEVMGTASVRRALAGPTAGPSSWPVRAPGLRLGLPISSHPPPSSSAEDEEDTLPRR